MKMKKRKETLKGVRKEWHHPDAKEEEELFGRGDEEESTDFSGFLEGEERERGSGVSSTLAETQSSTGTDVTTGVRVPTGTQGEQNVPVRDRGEEGLGVAGKPAARGQSHLPENETSCPEGAKGLGAGVSALAVAQQIAPEPQDGMEVDDPQSGYVLTGAQKRRIRKRQKRRVRERMAKMNIASPASTIPPLEQTEEKDGDGGVTEVVKGRAGGAGSGVTCDPAAGTGAVGSGAGSGTEQSPETSGEADRGAKRLKFSAVAGKGLNLRVVTPDGGRPSEDDLKEVEGVLADSITVPYETFRVESVHLTQCHIIIIAENETTLNRCRGAVQGMKRGDGSPRFTVLMPGEDPPLLRYTIVVPKRHAPNGEVLTRHLDAGNREDGLRVELMRVIRGWDNNEPENDRTRTYVLGFNQAQAQVLERLDHRLYCGVRRRAVLPYRRRGGP